MKPKILALRHDLSHFNCDICVLSETWLKPETHSRYVNFPDFDLTRMDRPDGKGYGGVSVLSRVGFKIRRLQSVCTCNICRIQTLWMSISDHRGRKFVLGAVYRSPRYTVCHLSADFNCLETQLQRVLLTSSVPAIISGDFNCNLLGPDSDHAKARLRQFLDNFSLYQFVRASTFRSGSLLAVFLSSFETLVLSVNVLPCSYSDHCFIKSHIAIRKLRNRARLIKSRCINRLNVVEFNVSLCHTDWGPVFSRVGVSDQWTAFLQLLLPILDSHAPFRRLKLHNPSAPPASDATLRLMAQRRGLLAREGRTPAFLTLDKRVKSAIRCDVRNDIASRVERQGPASIFRNVRQVIEGRKSAMRVVPEATPDELNEFFVGVRGCFVGGPRVAGDVLARGEPLLLPCRLPRVGACAFTLQPISLPGLRSILFSMKNSASSGSDGICIRILKQCFGSIGHVLLYLVNSCLTSCEFPASWKHLIVHPIHKSGDPSNPSNFRPSSIVPAFAKLVEKAVQQQLYSYMSDNHLFSPSQHGFRSLLSTETALLTVTDHILAATDRQELTLLCLLDLSKCFDVIDHAKLLSKLQAYSIDPTWFSSYLHGHTQSVCTVDGRGNRHLSKSLSNPWVFSKDPLLAHSCS